MTERQPLDGLVTRLLELSPFEYRLAADEAERRLAYRLRGQAVVAHGWALQEELPAGEERDDYDERALHVLGWDGATPMATGRLVLPPGLPTEEACHLVVRPAGQVVDVGRMCVAPAYQSRAHAAFIGLMCRLYQEMRAAGFSHACGMMTRPAMLLVRHLGLDLDRLGPERTYWNELRAPVHFGLTVPTAETSEAQHPAG
jgi:N-acyl-L-homoserine lactone synthetase